MDVGSILVKYLLLYQKKKTSNGEEHLYIYRRATAEPVNADENDSSMNCEYQKESTIAIEVQ
jgi:hypothetical protein